MMILKKQPKSLLDEYHDLEAKLGQTKKSLLISIISNTRHSQKNKHHLENE